MRQIDSKMLLSHTHIYIYIYLSVYTHNFYIHTFMYMYIYIYIDCMYIYIHIYIQYFYTLCILCIRTHLWRYDDAGDDEGMHIYIYVCVCTIYIYTYIYHRCMCKYCSCHVLKPPHPGPIRTHTQEFATEILLCEDRPTLLGPMQGSQYQQGFRV